jgi:hypothetical protein
MIESTTSSDVTVKAKPKRKKREDAEKNGKQRDGTTESWLWYSKQQSTWNAKNEELDGSTSG